MKSYDHKKIEKKWQEAWSKAKLYETLDSDPGKENFYLLVEFPYPSGNLHVGHWYSFAVPDILARMLRMKGKNVMYPIGFDAFGLPAENAAIKNKLNPRTWTENNIAYMKKQIVSMGASFDWSREVVTCDPEYYKWTQWLFLQLLKKGLVYRKETAVNWCPNDKTVLANEQVVDGKCERCGAEVVQKEMLQWNIKITDYADRLIDDLEPLDWPKEIKESQRNWIGKSEGAEIDFPLSIGVEHMNRVLLLHGKGGKPDGDFMQWAKAELTKRGFTVEIPELPNSSEPDDIEQAEFIRQNCAVDENTIIVGHSAGGLAAMRLLESNKVGRLVLVATPYSSTFLDGKNRPTVARSIERGYDYAKIKANVKGIVALYDIGDPIVPLEDGEKYAADLDAHLIKGRGTEGHFNAEKEPDVLMAIAPTIRVFTTRPDTLYGATYLVLAPEHPWVTLALGHKTVLKNNDEVQKYVDQANKKTELERMTDQKVKTGVKLEGVEAINPATSEKIPLYVADYVLANYGTGAIMAVPAHDERDYEFAKKFDLPTQQVVAPAIRDVTTGGKVQDTLPFRERNAVMCVVKHWKKDEYLIEQWIEHPEVKTFPSGGIEEGETPEEAGRREILEETGYKNAKFIRQIGGISFIEFYHRLKKTNIRAKMRYLYFQLQNGEQVTVSEEEQKIHTLAWKKRDEVVESVSLAERADIWHRFLSNEQEVYTGNGYLVNSNGFDGFTTEDAKQKITEKFGRKKTTYKLRDWIVSRQRYWGVPIPIIHCPKCGSVPVPDESLPVLLPETDDYLPEGSGKSPLAKISSFVKVECPQCGGEAERETDTLDTFVDSSWYFLRYCDPKNKKEFAAQDKMDTWMPVDLYSGGAEHTTMHLLYSRFWHKALFDIGLVKDAEPYQKRMNRSIILGPDGHKMSKSKGNVIDPDEIVERLGADTVRLYLAFVGPYNEVASYPWNPDGVVGVRRFLERIARLSESVVEVPPETNFGSPFHRTIKKVAEDISILKFNTAISALMVLLNAIEKTGSVNTVEWSVFLRLLAPFAPHLAEELWNESGKSTSIHLEAWPEYDTKYLREEVITIAIQIDGKMRGDIRIAADADKEMVEKSAREAVAARLKGRNVERVVVVPGRLVNFVLEK